MKLLKKVPEAAMVAAFLKAELTSARHGEAVKKAINQIGVAEKVVTQPNLDNESENESRAKVLGISRGYGLNCKIFKGLPVDLTWYKAELAREAIGDLHYIDYSYWNELSDHTHLVRHAVANIQRGNTVFDVSNDRFLAVADDIRHGKHDFEPMILWGESKDSTFTILEGHLRATAFCLAGESAPPIIKVIVGLRQSAVL